MWYICMSYTSSSFFRVQPVGFVVVGPVAIGTVVVDSLAVD